MYAGHFAAGLALKAKTPEAPTWGVLLGVGVLDILFGPFVLLGLEAVTLTPGQSPGFSTTSTGHILLSLPSSGRRSSLYCLFSLAGRSCR